MLLIKDSRHEHPAPSSTYELRREGHAHHRGRRRQSEPEELRRWDTSTSVTCDFDSIGRHVFGSRSADMLRNALVRGRSSDHNVAQMSQGGVDIIWRLLRSLSDTKLVTKQRCLGITKLHQPCFPELKVNSLVGNAKPGSGRQCSGIGRRGLRFAASKLTPLMISQASLRSRALRVRG
jgi:hypothetical protein